MVSQIIFAIALLITLSIFAFTTWRYVRLFMLTQPAFRVRNFGKRFGLMMKVAIGQTKMFRRPILGLIHALVFWGFLVILIGSIEMVIDGLAGLERSLSVLGWFYNFIIASGDVFAIIIVVAIAIFLSRRLFMHVKRFEGIEMKRISHVDANVALTIILLLMISLLGLNASYVAYQTATNGTIHGYFPIGNYLAGLFGNMSLAVIHTHHQVYWWSHILLIFVFANLLPYSKHFHVFMSVPNVFLSRLEPLGKLPNMENVTREVKIMMNPETAYAAAPANAPIERFGVRDAEDASWKSYLDSLSCTECGRCTSVCPANITGKKLSPRKVMMDLRARMKEKRNGLIAQGKEYSDGKSLLRDYISEEELWACTTCNACAQECPINIDHPKLIVDMRRYLVMEEGSAPGELKAVFSNIENNGAPWQYSPEDRLIWAENLEMNKV
ncbi:MAG TPA: (Fe-S)-binding protein [Tenuifilaceae bacterium]|jgi:heterodisulfide reductase subunit C/nitrate reductase gamma subunit|nr:(Fe-S)-binding protein [Bacteroidota bacterium]MZP82669.1 4Fe-4S dicluster domain-containing protein [Bacteroidales bacterium]NLH57732.1 (Fe-S)-binding protein [Rikenellaceae bacterium]OQC63423.1 MAG: succinate dehydrogenase/fumarate reductase iron-sulfur subunit [Bacteroidetes bacterium ADurb.Bin008]HNV82481.1 (Fe-S)-binding protein [Tenuifilaceae bacterium]